MSRGGDRGAAAFVGIQNAGSRRAYVRPDAAVRWVIHLQTEKIRRLNWRIAHNGANTIFVQLTFFGSIYILFLNELGLPKTRIGFLLSLVPFSGVLSLFIAPAVARLGIKRVFITCWTLRTVVAAFLLLIPWTMAHYGAEPAFCSCGCMSDAGKKTKVDRAGSTSTCLC